MQDGEYRLLMEKITNLDEKIDREFKSYGIILHQDLMLSSENFRNELKLIQTDFTNKYQELKKDVNSAFDKIRKIEERQGTMACQIHAIPEDAKIKRYDFFTTTLGKILIPIISSTVVGVLVYYLVKQ